VVVAVAAHNFRTFAAGESAGYHNATLGTAGVAVPFPIGAQGAMVMVSAGCYLGVRNNSTLLTFNDTNYGSIQNGAAVELNRSGQAGDNSIHIAPWATTAIVSIVFF